MKEYFSKEEILQIRRDTPGSASVIHFNNAGAALMNVQVFGVMEAYLRDELYLGGYETAEKWREEIRETYTEIARLIHAQPDEIALLESATTAWYKAFHSMKFQKGDRILCCESEYGSNYIGLLQARDQFGIEIEVIPSDHDGVIDLEALENMIDERVRLLAITHMPTNGGLVNPAEEVGEIAARHGIPYLLDACQSVGQYPIDVKKLRCTFLSATGRKYMRAPRGTGFLFIKKEKIEGLESVFPDMMGGTWMSSLEYIPRQDAKKYENFENNRAGLLGLGKAAAYTNQWGIERIWGRTQWLAQKLRNRLGGVGGVEITDLGREKSGLVTFRMDGKHAGEVKRHLKNQHINVSVSAAWSTRIDMEKRGLNELLRASVHYYNIEEEIDFFVKVIEGMAK